MPCSVEKDHIISFWSSRSAMELRSRLAQAVDKLLDTVGTFSSCAMRKVSIDNMTVAFLRVRGQDTLVRASGEEHAHVEPSPFHTVQYSCKMCWQRCNLMFRFNATSLSFAFWDIRCPLHLLTVDNQTYGVNIVFDMQTGDVLSIHVTFQESRRVAQALKRIPFVPDELCRRLENEILQTLTDDLMTVAVYDGPVSFAFRDSILQAMRWYQYNEKFRTTNPYRYRRHVDAGVMDKVMEARARAQVGLLSAVVVCPAAPRLLSSHILDDILDCSDTVINAPDEDRPPQVALVTAYGLLAEAKYWDAKCMLNVLALPPKTQCRDFAAFGDSFFLEPGTRCMTWHHPTDKVPVCASPASPTKALMLTRKESAEDDHEVCPASEYKGEAQFKSKLQSWSDSALETFHTSEDTFDRAHAAVGFEKPSVSYSSCNDLASSQVTTDEESTQTVIDRGHRGHSSKTKLCTINEVTVAAEADCSTPDCQCCFQFHVPHLVQKDTDLVEQFKERRLAISNLRHQFCDCCTEVSELRERRFGPELPLTVLLQRRPAARAGSVCAAEGVPGRHSPQHEHTQSAGSSFKHLQNLSKGSREASDTRR